MLNDTDTKESPNIFAQITDCHLFSDRASLHHGQNVFDNLKKILSHICNNSAVKFIVCTGDITQDHTEQSYLNFVNCVLECDVKVPMYFLAGNHDEPKLLAKYFSIPPFISSTTIDLAHWQIQLVDSKSDSPAGYVNEQALMDLHLNIEQTKHQLLMMHHHPIDVGYFIDKHGLKNKEVFWQGINQYNNIKAMACGHVHGAMELTLEDDDVLKAISSSVNHYMKNIPLYTCPATSIQFDPTFDGVKALPLGPGYRTFHLSVDGKIASKVHIL